jgi:malate synthase
MSLLKSSEVVFDCPQQTILVEPIHETAAARLLLYCCFTQDRARVQATNNIAANDRVSIVVMLLTGERRISYSDQSATKAEVNSIS